MEKRPTEAEIRYLLREAGLPQAAEEIAFLGDGWEMWAFRAGDSVVRLPKDPGNAQVRLKLQREAAATKHLAPLLPLPISQPEVHLTPGGIMFSLHRFVAGVPLRDIKRPPAADFGAELGRFLRVLHSLPVAPLRDLGVEVMDGPTLRSHNISRYEQLARRLFPLLSCEARSYVTSVVDAYQNNDAAFAFTPVVTHCDIDERNVLADPVTGSLSGVIDFGDITITRPAADFDGPCWGGFASMGIADQLPDLLREGGISEATMEHNRDFMPLWWRLQDIEHWLDLGDDELARESMEELDKVVPYGTKC